ncbi:TPM domain-containing protein [Afifella sp. JA880]|uniref:TPM domain-containing protein n=1 Tax=Afifella sp. JA880 TaxID=2975280 RepID=UPI0021BB8018|nr:TPM domain-containing protein [Afifella sp. JA880]MCT8268583.1 TPM domain-containing protein [Afifella sp. JA880]
MRALFAAVLILVAPAFIAPAAAQDFPKLTGRVVDAADLLSPTEEAELVALSDDLEKKTSDQLVIATVPSLDGRSIEQYGVDLGRAWQIGQKDKDNGVLLLVAPNERQVRIEVGYGLEPTLTDAISKLIIEGSIIPRFKAGDFPGGIKRGVEDIVAVLGGDREAWVKRAKERVPEGDIGPTIFTMIFLAVFFIIMFSGLFGPRGKGRRRTGGFVGGLNNYGGGFGGGGGGGFSGGGGSFGGGGSSGSW